MCTVEVTLLKSLKNTTCQVTASKTSQCMTCALLCTVAYAVIPTPVVRRGGLAERNAQQEVVRKGEEGSHFELLLRVARGGEDDFHNSSQNFLDRIFSQNNDDYLREVFPQSSSGKSCPSKCSLLRVSANHVHAQRATGSSQKGGGGLSF